MTTTTPSARRRAEITNAFGLHLRPAALLAEAAQRFVAEVRVGCGGVEADGKSTLALLGLAAARGAVLEVMARGTDAEAAVAALADLITGGFHETGECQVA